MLLTDSYQDY